MGTPNFENRTLYYGDNLPALRRMNSESVHLIATDPPFKKQRGFFSDAGGYDDRWTWQKDILGLDRRGNGIAENHDDWIDQIQNDWSRAWSVIEAARTVYGDDMGAFLCWLGVRLMEMRRILRDNGSIYLHIDHTAHAWVKALMDSVFGIANFKSEIVWRRTTSHSDAKGLGSVHDSILFYTKSSESTWNPIFQPLDPEYVENYYRYKDPDGRRFMSADLSGAGPGPKRNFGERGEIAPPKDRHWMHDDAGITRLLLENRIFWTRNGVPRLKVYLDERPGTPADDVWVDILPLRSWHKERRGYPTQKPLALYERIIQASSNPGDIVLDPFCGCATTPVAAERLGRQWVGMDIWEKAYTEITNRLREYNILVDDTEQEGQFNDNGMLQFTEYRLTLIDNREKGEEFPARTDDNEVAAPSLNLKRRRPTEPWQQLSNALMRRILNVAQQRNGLVGCAGCGRLLEPDFFHLDHISPKSQGGENYITNRILICAPCNSRKSDTKTLKGLQNDNRKDKWMKDRKLAEEMQSFARMRSEWTRDNWGTPQCQGFIASLP
jgi:DNA modification methylase/5-methylcytosine-specific restriction endonuclease McrA